MPKSLRIVLGCLLVLGLCHSSAHAKFLVFGEKVGPGTQINDFNRNLSLQTPSSLWNISSTANMISITHAQDFDVYINLQKSVYRSEFVERVFSTRKADLKEFMPHAYFWIEEEVLKIAGVKALMLRYEDLINDRMYQEIYFVIDKTAYQLSFVAKPNTFFKRQDDFDSIAKSLKILGNSPAKSVSTQLVEDNTYNPANSAGF